MEQDASFSVNTRLARLLGEGYRSSELAIRELVDNAWDADAKNVWIMLPSALSTDPITVKDDGCGMTEAQLRTEYLDVASDRRERSGDRTRQLNRRVKGRKGIGKFSGLAIAQRMTIEAVARGRKSILVILKDALMKAKADLERVPLPLSITAAREDERGTKILLENLDQRFNFPTAEKLRELLAIDYGREDHLTIYVNGESLSVEDLPGEKYEEIVNIPGAGKGKLTFVVSDVRRPLKSPGIVLRVNGKSVGKPHLFGLTDSEIIPDRLKKCVYGQIEVDGLEDDVSADWGAVSESSKAFQEVSKFVTEKISDGLNEVHMNAISLQKARLQKQLIARLQRIPEHRRTFADQEIKKILSRFYGESDDRISIIVDVALDAMEHDAYWIIIEKIRSVSPQEVHELAEALQEFGLLELSAIGTQARHRQEILNYFESIARNSDALEKDLHKVIEANPWILGRNYSLISSNTTLRATIRDYCSKRFSDSDENKRPDLLLAENFNDSYVLVEFKRPSKNISHEDLAQAANYRDHLQPKLDSTKPINVLLIGGGRQSHLDASRLHDSISILSYVGVVSAARSEIDWLLTRLVQTR